MKNFKQTIRKQVFILVMLLGGMSLMAEQVVIDVNIKYTQNGGGTNQTSVLETALNAAYESNPSEIAEITDLKVTVSNGAYLDTKDFTYLNANLTSLVNLDLSVAAVSDRADGVLRTNFPANAFLNNTTVETISLPTTLGGIGAGAFFNCALKGDITIPVGIDYTAITSTNFGNSSGITGFIADPSSLKMKIIEGVVFSYDETTIQFYPSGKTDASYTIPEGVTTLRNGAFDYTHYLKNLTLSSTFTTLQAGGIRFDALASHSEIENVFVTPGNALYDSANGVLYQKEGNRAVWSPLGKPEVRISAPVAVIAGGGSQNTLFGGAGGATTNYIGVIALVDFPATLTGIENGAFNGASKLATVISRATVPPTTMPQTFNAVGGSLTPAWSTKVYVPANSLETYKTSPWVDGINGAKAFNSANFIAFYNLTLTGATAASTIATDIAPLSGIVTVTADAAPDGQAFRRWTSTPEVGFADATNPVTTFVQPASDVSIAAVFETYYTVSVTDGSATVNQVAAGNVFAGDVVTITADAAPQGKAFKNWASTTPGVEFADATNPTTTFTQPASDVSIEAVYADLIAYTIADATITQSGTAIAGATVTLETAATKGAANNEIFQQWEVTTGTATIADANAASTSFTMPEAPVTITAVYKTLYTIAVTGGTATVATAYAGDVVTITAAVPADYTFANWTSSTEGVTFAAASDAVTTFTMPASDVSIEAVFAVPYTIIGATTPSGTALAGSTVNIETPATQGTDNNDVFQQWTVTAGTATIADANAASTSFTMPEAPVTITAVYKTLYTISVTGGTATIAALPVEKAYAGDVVTITADNAPAGKKFGNWTSSDGVSFADANSATTTFTVPANSVAIAANFVDDLTGIVNVSLTVNVKYTIYNTVGTVVAQGITNGATLPGANLPQGIYILKTAEKAIRFINK
jgi:hypothetical protein